MDEIITNSATETLQLGSKIAEKVSSGGVLALYGNLGSGKTTFVQGLGKGIGITKQVNSPTFILIRSYELNERSFYHIDLYRIQNLHDIQTLGLHEILENKNNIVVIEWPEVIEKLLPGDRINIFFDYINETTRKITFSRLNI